MDKTGLKSKAERLAFIISQTICAQAAIEGMRAENLQREHCGHSMAYSERTFCEIPEEFGLTADQVLAYLSEATP